jgi:hypothetical protein
LASKGHSREDVMHGMHIGMVNQLMTCYWLERGVEVTSPDQQSKTKADVVKSLGEIKKRKIKFDF